MNTQRIASTILAFLSLSFFCIASLIAEEFDLKQALIDGVNDLDGLDNPRQVKFSPNGKHVWVTSADDNALLLLELNENLTPIHVFKNDKALYSEKAFKLEGATGLALLDGGKSAIVTSFYDSALSTFKIDSHANFIGSEITSDNLGYERVFKSNESLREVDNLGILGAWGIDVSLDEKQVFVASYKSDAISVFDVNEDARLIFNTKITSVDLTPNNPGRPVSIVYSHIYNELIAAGYEGNVLNIFAKNERGTFTLNQTIVDAENKSLVNPQYMVLSPDNRFLYVACSGNSSISVFERTDDGYLFLQSMTQAQTQDSGLTGVAALAVSNDGLNLYAAGEFDKGVLEFNISDNGKLSFKKIIQTHANEIEGVTSIALSNDGKHMLLSLGKKDALFLLEKNE